MAGGMTYLECVLGDEIHRLRAQAVADLRESVGTQSGQHPDDDEFMQWHAAEMERRRAALAMRPQPPARPPDREAVICAPSRHSFASTWREKQQLCARLEDEAFLRKDARQVAYEWGYIRALRDMGQTAEADRLERKMRRGSIFRVEKGKATAEVKELETLYER